MIYIIIVTFRWILNCRKREEWVKKTEKNKLEEEKRLKEKQKLIQPISSSSAMKKPTPLVTKPEGGVGATGFPKPKYNFGPSTSKMPNHNLPLVTCHVMTLFVSTFVFVYSFDKQNSFLIFSHCRRIHITSLPPMTVTWMILLNQPKTVSWIKLQKDI